MGRATGANNTLDALLEAVGAGGKGEEERRGING